MIALAPRTPSRRLASCITPSSPCCRRRARAHAGKQRAQAAASCNEASWLVHRAVL